MENTLLRKIKITCTIIIATILGICEFSSYLEHKRDIKYLKNVISSHNSIDMIVINKVGWRQNIKVLDEQVIGNIYKSVLLDIEESNLMYRYYGHPIFDQTEYVYNIDFFNDKSVILHCELEKDLNTNTTLIRYYDANRNRILKRGVNDDGECARLINSFWLSKRSVFDLAY